MEASFPSNLFIKMAYGKITTVVFLHKLLFHPVPYLFKHGNRYGYLVFITIRKELLLFLPSTLERTDEISDHAKIY